MRRVCLLSLLLALVVGGCQPGQEEINFTPRPKTYSTVASLSPGSSEIVGSLAYAAKLVGRTAACNFPPNVKNAPVVAQVKPDYEKLKAASPGLVIYETSLYSEQDIAQIKALGADTFQFKAKTIKDFTKEIREFGKLMAVETEASNYADKIENEEKAALAAAPSPPPTIALIMPGSGGEHYIAGTQSFQADVVRASGGKPVGPAQDRYVPINAEALIKLNPDIIITAGNPTPLVDDPRLASLPAIAKVKVRGINIDLATRMGFRVDQEINRLARAIADVQEGK